MDEQTEGQAEGCRNTKLKIMIGYFKAESTDNKIM